MALGWIGLGAAIVLVFWIGDLAQPTYSADGGWYLQITSRAADGDLPYRDFYLGTLPFPLWVNLGATSLFGTEIAVQKLLADVALVATALLAAHLALGLGVPRTGAVIVGLAGLAAAILPTTLPYTPYSYFFLLAALAAVLAWRRAADRGDARRATRLVAVAGALAGLSASGKQTVGAAVLLAIVACALFWSPREGEWGKRALDAALASGIAAAVVALFLLPVAFGGGLDEFWAQAIDKSQYVQSSSGSYVDGLRTFAESLVDPIGDGTALRLHAVFLLPLLAAGALVWAAVRRRRPELMPLAIFAIAALAPALARPAYFNVVYTVPVCALAIAVAWPLPKESLPRWVKPALAVVLGVGVALNLAREPIRTIDQGAAVAGLDHYRGTLFPEVMLDQAKDLNEDLRAADSKGDVFILSPFSGFLYLTSGVESTTPHDYAALDSMRDSGEDEVLGLLEAGEIESVCLGNYELLPGQELPDLEAFVREEMEPSDPQSLPVRYLPPWQCRVYEPRTGSR